MPAVQLPAIVVFRHQVQQILRAADRECRDQDIALRRACRVEHLCQLVERLLERPVQPITVRAFHEHGICVLERLYRIHDRRIAKTEVATENDLPFPVLALVVQFDDRRAQDVARVVIRQRQAGDDFNGRFIGHPFELLQASLTVFLRIQRLD